MIKTTNLSIFSVLLLTMGVSMANTQNLPYDRLPAYVKQAAQPLVNNLVRLVTVYADGDAYNCTGLALSGKTVLTAAHCIKNYKTIKKLIIYTTDNHQQDFVNAENSPFFKFLLAQ